MAIDEEVLGWVRSAVVADSWEAVGSALRARDPEGDDLRLRPFVIAFSYRLHEYFSSARESAGAAFGPIIAGAGWQFPPPLADIPDDEVELWREALDLVGHPVAQARLGDLLWERKWKPDPHLAAGAACDALLTLAADPAWRDMERVRCLSRALELARGIHNAKRKATVVSSMLAFAEHDLTTPGWSPGIALGALQPLVALPPDERPEGLDDMLRRVDEKYGADTHIVDSVADVRNQLVPAGDRNELRRQQVQRWREESGKGDGMLRVMRLERALEIAHTYGLKTEAEEIRRELGTIDAGDLGLKTISTEIEMPAGEAERFVRSFEEAETWQIAFHTLAAQPPPGGAPDDLGQQVDQMMEEHPVQFLFGKSLVGPDNVTAVFRAVTPDDQRRLALAEQRAREARIWGIFCAEAVKRIGSRPDRPDRSALTAFFRNAFIDEETAERVACAVELFWDEHYDESAHVLVPRLERVLRDMARQVGVPIVREPQPGREIGGVETLGLLLGRLEGAFADASWHAYLVNLLTDPLGLNLRNRISHGLHGTVGAVDSSLLIQAAVLLSSMSLEPVEDLPEMPPGAARVEQG
jgi:hypothetical protein